MLRPKKNSYKEFDKEKNSSDSKIPHPPPTPIILLMVYTLGQTIQPILYWTHLFSFFPWFAHGPIPGESW